MAVIKVVPGCTSHEECMSQCYKHSVPSKSTSLLKLDNVKNGSNNKACTEHCMQNQTARRHAALYKSNILVHTACCTRVTHTPHCSAQQDPRQWVRCVMSRCAQMFSRAVPSIGLMLNYRCLCFSSGPSKQGATSSLQMSSK